MKTLRRIGGVGVPTERHHSTGTPTGRVQLDREVRDGVGQVGGALDRGARRCRS